MEFADIALAKFLQTVPELGNMIVTFKDMSDELPEDSDIQIGVFVVRSGSELVFVPVVSKGETVYPIDSVFFQSSGKFFPLTKMTSERIINSQQIELGQATKIPQTVTQNPNMYDFINPPRTGKFTYASSSRLVEFLAAIPSDQIKDHVLEKIASAETVYKPLNKLFNLADIVSALKVRNPVAAPTVAPAPIQVLGESDSGLSQEEVRAILDKGYAIRGEAPSTRIAIATQRASEFKTHTLSRADAGYDYEISMNDGSTRWGFVPNSCGFIPTGANGTSKEEVAVIFEDGSYAITSNVVATGEPSQEGSVFSNLLNYRPGVMLRDVESGQTFALFDMMNNLIGIYRASRSGVISHDGVTLKAFNRIDHNYYTILASRNIGKIMKEGSTLFVPYNSLVVVLDNDIDNDLEVSAFNAQRKKEVTQTSMLGNSLDIGFDGVEFSVNGSPVGPEAGLARLLIIKEAMDPTIAESFIKRAKEEKHLKVYLSKKADFEPGEIPQFGNPAPEQVNPLGLDGSFTPNVQQALTVNDSQAVEATIISELLQVPDLFENISEYMPDIEEAIDKLGRILFLSRVHINRLAESNDPDGVFAFLYSIKNVYKLLGDNYTKLQRLTANAEKI